jgi:hypothetical protein
MQEMMDVHWQCSLLHNNQSDYVLNFCLLQFRKEFKTDGKIFTLRIGALPETVLTLIIRQIPQPTITAIENISLHGSLSRERIVYLRGLFPSAT